MTQALKEMAMLLAGIDHDMPGRRYWGPFSPLSLAEQDIEQQLKKHIHVLAHEIGPRSIFHPDAYSRTIRYITDHLQECDLPVEEQRFPCSGGQAVNLISVAPGQRMDDAKLIIGAHFDTVGTTPGANDNGTGVAALLEIGRQLQQRDLKHAVTLAFFTNEEPPFFGSHEMGSRYYAKSLRDAGSMVYGMLCLETIGYYSETTNSQRAPELVSALHRLIDPLLRGNFVGFFSNKGSSALLKAVIDGFRRTTLFPTEGIASDHLDGASLSDHASFWEEGYKAVMVTDTAMMRYPYYHSNEDTEDKINFPCLSRVVSGLVESITRIANS